MAVTREERNRILGMVEEGLVSADEAGQLFDALLEEPVAPPARPVQNRTLRVWVTDTTTRTRQVNMTVNLIVWLFTGKNSLVVNFGIAMQAGFYGKACRHGRLT